MAIKSFIVEFIGTFVLVFFMGMSRFLNQQNLLIVGLVAFFMISALTHTFAHVSGAHFNPILSLCLTITNQITIVNSIIFVICQMAGAFLAGLLIHFLSTFPGRNIEDAIPMINDDKRLIAVVLESISMFLLVFVYNAVMNNPAAPKYIFGAAIGSVYLVCIVSFGIVSGGCINSALVIGPGVYINFYDDMGFYVLGHLIGGVIAGTVYKLFLRKGDLEDDTNNINIPLDDENIAKSKTE